MPVLWSPKALGDVESLKIAAEPLVTEVATAVESAGTGDWDPALEQDGYRYVPVGLSADEDTGSQEVVAVARRATSEENEASGWDAGQIAYVIVRVLMSPFARDLAKTAFERLRPTKAVPEGTTGSDVPTRSVDIDSLRRNLQALKQLAEEGLIDPDVSTALLRKVVGEALTDETTSSRK